MRHRGRWSWLVALLALPAACGGTGGSAPAADHTWAGATALSATEDSPFGVVSDGVDVLFTTGRTQVGDHALRAAPLQPADPPASRLVLTDPNRPVPNGRLALDGGDVYVAAGTGIIRVSKATGAITPVVDGRPTEVTSIVVDGTYVWWTTSTYQFPAAGEVARRPKRGGPVEVLAAGVDAKGQVYQNDPGRMAVALPGASSFGSLVLDGQAVLVASPGGILRVAPGRKTETIADAAALGGAPTGIAADGDRIYATIAGRRNNLVSVLRSGGRPSELAPNVDNTADIVVAGGEVYFLLGGGAGGRATIEAVPATGGSSRVVTSGRYAGGDLAASAGRVLFSADGRVWSAPVRSA